MSAFELDMLACLVSLGASLFALAIWAWRLTRDDGSEREIP